MQLKEKQKLNLNHKLSKFIPDYPQGDKITIHHLLSHTAGIPDYTSVDGYKRIMRNPTSPQQLIELFKNKPLEFEPGSQFVYSNSGYVLLGYIIETITGKPYKQILEEFILKPLKMENTGYESANPSLENRSVGYLKIGKNFIKAPKVEMTVPYAAGAMYSTVNDLFKWHQTLKGEQILKKESLQQMFTPVKGNYGYGWRMDTLFDQKRIYHGGTISGYRSAFIQMPEKDLLFITLANTHNVAEGFAKNLAAIVLDHIQNTPAQKVAIQVPQQLLDKYTGTYSLRENFQFVITTEKGKLFVQGAAFPKYEVIPESEVKFLVKEVNATFIFKQNDKGEVTHFVMQQPKKEDKDVKKIK